MQVTVIGSMGFVGSAMARAFKQGGHEVIEIDKKNAGSPANQYAMTLESDAVFICVPTPYDPACRTYDYTAVWEVLHRFVEVPPAKKPMICLRSTVAPDFFEGSRAFNLVDVYHPEFLRAKHADEDFANPDVHVFGAEYDEKHVAVIREIYRACNITPKADIVTSRAHAAALKLIHNVHRALRISFLNELYVAAGSQLEWSRLQPALSALFAAREMGGSYMDVPGSDGKFGFGGGCFPKDLAAYIGYLERHNKPHEILDAVVSVNSKMRLPG